MPQPVPGRNQTATRTGQPPRREIIYTTTGCLGFLQTETAHSVTIQLAPDRTLTLPKDEIECRFKLV
jgi:hypothetical protein